MEARLRRGLGHRRVLDAPARHRTAFLPRIRHTAAITGAYVALADAVSWAKEQDILKPSAKVLTDSISAISVGVIDGTPMLDLPYVEDVRAQTDMNVVQTGDGRFIEVQGTAEHAPFNAAQKLALEAPLMERIEVRP